VSSGRFYRRFPEAKDDENRMVALREIVKITLFFALGALLVVGLLKFH